jgi:hypothetical protein
VFWYLTTHADGVRPLVGYLSRPGAYRASDADLFDSLRRVHAEKGDAVTLQDIEQSGVLPDNTLFYGVPLSTTALGRTARREARERWFENGCGFTHACDLIFLDPDTGLMPTRRNVQNANGEEYATNDEIVALCRRGQSVVCVQFGAPGNFEREPLIARQRLAALTAALTAECFPKPWGLWWQDGHKVGLIVAPSAPHADTLRARTDELLAEPDGTGKSVSCNRFSTAIRLHPTPLNPAAGGSFTRASPRIRVQECVGGQSDSLGPRALAGRYTGSSTHRQMGGGAQSRWGRPVPGSDRSTLGGLTQFLTQFGFAGSTTSLQTTDSKDTERCPSG